ncbi:unnamed protein product [Fusarium langsethiae]|nr:unnamed protein product [Fusarium langsethiae]
MDSPPKRMTRARAAAKATEPSVKTTKIVTAAARARSTATAGTKSTAAKRKTRADENDEDEEQQREVAVVRRTRGRPRKAGEVEEPEPEPEAPAKPTRGRIVKKTATEAPKPTTTTTATATAPAKPTRGRPRKAVATEEPAPAPVQKTTTIRTRTTTSSITTKPRTLAKPALKKSVKFQEPDKENIEPAVEAKEPARTGIRGRPAKRGGAAGSRTTRAAVRSADSTESKPLSPKKITQIPVSKDDESEDELAGDMPPVKPMMKSPIKPPTNTVKTQPEHTEEPESISASESIINPPSLGAPVLRSPAKRQPASPDRDTLRSPARRIGHIALPGSTMKMPQEGDIQAEDGFSSKNSLLQSAAKRPQSPIKGLNFGVSLQPQQSQSAMKASLLLSPPKRAMPGLKPVTEPRPRDVGGDLGEPPIMKPLVLGTPSRAPSTRPSDKLMSEEQAELDLDTVEDDVFNRPLENLEFPGRLSAVLPRHADPAWKKDMGIVDEPQEKIDAVEEPQTEPETVEDVQEEAVEPEPITEAAELTEEEEDSMVVDEDVADEDVVEAGIDLQETEPESEIPAHSPVQEQNPMYQLREKDLEPQDTDSESDDEDAAPTHAVPVTPTPFVRKTPKTSRASMGGFSALADRLGSWKASTPVKMAPLTTGGKKTGVLSDRVATPKSMDSPASTHFFDDEMTVRAGMEDLQADNTAEIVDPDFDDMEVTEEDVELAQEANEMSLMEPDVLEEVVNTDAFDDTLSEASQEYGDENEIPFSMVPTTPVRPVMKTFNTTTKVPLKPADDSSPTPLKKRSFSASRAPPKRPSGSTRSTAALPYSPKGRKSMPATIPESPSTPSIPAPATPSKSDLWSSLGTPARTPRRDLNPAILRGAVVFVDVYTSEGADASSIFVELLTQMGAKCMKSWNWNPSGSENDTTSSKIGITHVVFKDGSKRILEKVHESNGVVQCVGVSWVLDCERLNDWVEESPYKIDTSNVPRGGARRRKSMEPKALANMNGTLVTSPTKGGSRTTPSTPSNRRQSTQWMYTPSEQDEDDEMEDFEWSEAILTPVPKTPAPEAIARYAANLDLESASVDDDDDDDLDESPTKDALLMRTCPPKKSIREMGTGLLSQTKDDGVLMRIMAARRKSLQFAPKIGSPLARTWQ